MCGLFVVWCFVRYRNIFWLRNILEMLSIWLRWGNSESYCGWIVGIIMALTLVLFSVFLPVCFILLLNGFVGFEASRSSVSLSHRSHSNIYQPSAKYSRHTRTTHCILENIFIDLEWKESYINHKPREWIFYSGYRSMVMHRHLDLSWVREVLWCHRTPGPVWG